MQSKQVPQVLVGSMDAIFPFEREKIFERAEIFFLSKGKTTYSGRRPLSVFGQGVYFPFLSNTLSKGFTIAASFWNDFPIMDQAGIGITVTMILMLNMTVRIILHIVATTINNKHIDMNL